MRAVSRTGTPAGSSLLPTGASFSSSSDSKLVTFAPFPFQGSTVCLMVINTSAIKLKIDGSAWFSPWFDNHGHAQAELLPGARCFIEFTTTPTINDTREWHVLCRFSKTGWLSFLDNDQMAVALHLVVG